jgi:hypothetical protein
VGRRVARLRPVAFMLVCSIWRDSNLACGYAVEGNNCPRELTSLIRYSRHFCPAGAAALRAIYCHDVRRSIFRRKY